MHSGDHDLESAADGLRRLADLLLRVDTDDPALVSVAEQLDRITALIVTSGVTAGEQDPVSGRGNAIAPPLDLEVDNGTASATGVLGLVHQGPKGLVHGGMSALTLSHVLSIAGAVDGKPTAVQELSVRYHRPTPLFTELHISGSLTDPAGRQASGAIEVDGVTTVSAEVRLALPPQP
ncbi:PaaI family thioesterase [Williamsia sp.]|uniref:PaaI family thioesterase n=1 Tax=Williamsia sp. TaxID=1872085 RepID=UPI002F93416C